MAKAQHVAKLREGAPIWNAWRAEHPGLAPDLSDLKLPANGWSLGGTPGGGIDLRRANLRRAVLAGVDLARACLEDADLSGADLSGANLAGADLARARLAGTNLSGARLDGARSLTQEQLDRARGCRSTVLPAGLAFPPGWVEGETAAPPAKPAASSANGRSIRPQDDPHAILGVEPTASAAEIRAAYLRLVKELHPDGRANGGAVPDDADERLRLINDAYRELKDADKRATAQRAEARRRARRASAIFVAGVMTPVVPLGIALMTGAYYAGWFGASTPQPASISAGQVGTAVSEHTKEPDAERRIAWRDAEREGTREAIERFLADYPDGETAAAATAALAAITAAETRRIEERRAWEAVESSRDKGELERFVAAFPDSANAPEARNRIAAIAAAEARRTAEAEAWTAAEADGSRDAFERFLSTHPDGAHAADAREALAILLARQARQEADRAAWAKADRSGAKSALQQYLADFPEGSFAGEARDRIARLQVEENAEDDAAWLKAAQSHDKAAYAGYLAAHPAGRRASDAKLRLAELELSEKASAEPAQAAAAAAGRPGAQDPQAASQQHLPVDEPSPGADERIRR